MKVLFVCHGNIGRSNTAKGFYNLFTKSNDAEAAGVADDTDYSLSVAEVVNSKKQQHPDFFAAFFRTTLEKGIDMTTMQRQQLTQDMIFGGGV